jgi:hypothetical protein
LDAAVPEHQESTTSRPLPHFGVERRSCGHERRDVGDCIADQESVAFGCDVNRLVEILARGGVDRDELDVGSIEFRQVG